MSFLGHIVQFVRFSNNKSTNSYMALQFSIKNFSIWLFLIEVDVKRWKKTIKSNKNSWIWNKVREKFKNASRIKEVSLRLLCRLFQVTSAKCGKTFFPSSVKEASAEPYHDSRCIYSFSLFVFWVPAVNNNRPTLSYNQESLVI